MQILPGEEAGARIDVLILALGKIEFGVNNQSRLEGKTIAIAAQEILELAEPF